MSLCKPLRNGYGWFTKLLRSVIYGRKVSKKIVMLTLRNYWTNPCPQTRPNQSHTHRQFQEKLAVYPRQPTHLKNGQRCRLTSRLKNIRPVISQLIKYYKNIDQLTWSPGKRCPGQSGRQSAYNPNVGHGIEIGELMQSVTANSILPWSTA